ncbi:Rhodanese-like domain-containing protein [Fimicolochytrium jonesii]|uniref:Rhodanese-like domain-containing protein n=1 Tax=Fimicolochytrium jonesii TaxID=1396493 RepID=UPI0022FE1BA5|nr:Rhodanese-like domain-containing protein [Fimicolochytrium jonesii]KAI8818627.1 Rhodanese-like domain-containing protein [Fimicolochytrium jonesii]
MFRIARSIPASAVRLAATASRPTLTRYFSQTAPSQSLFTDYVDKVRPAIKEITARELNGQLTKEPFNPPADLHVLDVREPYEWNEFHLPNAIYTGRGTLEGKIESLVPNTEDSIVVYCASGYRSILAADALKNMGYKKVYSLKGGISAWKGAGLPVSQNPNVVL